MDRLTQETIEILLIENNQDYFQVLGVDLNSNGAQEFAITHADRMSAALQFLTARQFDVILADLDLPDSQGFETFATLNHFANDIPILIVTGHDDEKLALDVVRSGAQDYLVEGQFSPASLVRSIFYAIERHQTKKKYQRMSLIDELTGLYNRRGFYYFARQQLKLVRRSKEDLLLIIADLDNMKFINDNFGHREGDKSLQTVADILKVTLRSTDIISRLDGDEFTVIAIGASKGDAGIIKSRVLKNLALHNQKNGQTDLSLSMGAAQYNHQGAMTLEDLIARADQNLYAHKRGKLQLPSKNNRSPKVI